MTKELLDHILSEIPKDEIIKKSRDIISDICKGGKKFTMHVPPSKNCSDMILCEVIKRYENHIENVIGNCDDAKDDEFSKVALKVQGDWGMGGLAGTIYEDYARECFNEYIKILNK